jgi:ferritin-like metal-binding protein YciE
LSQRTAVPIAGYGDLASLGALFDRARTPMLSLGAEDGDRGSPGRDQARQVKTLEKVFKSIGEKASGENCDAIEGLIKETEGIIDDADGAVALNAAVIAAAQAVEHYEISRYGSLREWAKVLGHQEAHDLLTSILDEEKAANNILTNLAVSTINKTR